MSRYGRVWVVYRKELVDTLRDRRTLLAMVLVPIVLYPVLMIVLIEALKSEAGRQEREQYTVCVPDENHRRWLEGVLAREEAERSVELGDAASDEEGSAESPPKEAFLTRVRSQQITIRVVEPEQSLWDLVSEGHCHVALQVEPPPNPENFADADNRVVQIIYSDTDLLSEVMFHQLDSILNSEMDRIVQARVAVLGDSDEVLSPLRMTELSTTSPDRQFGKVLALVVPFLLVTMTVTGAIYPAIDLTAGERERGTLETLAVSPVPVGQIVAGKFGVIVTIAMVSTVLNLGSMTAVVHVSKLDQLIKAQSSTRGGDDSVEALLAGDADLLGPLPSGRQREYLQQRRALERGARQRVSFLTTAAPIVLLSMVPFAVLFAALMLAVCSFARTFKEAQNYMMPVMMAAIVPAMVVSYMPTVKLEGPMLVIPVANVVVLMRELFLGNFDLAAMSICLLSTCFYAAAAVTMAVRVYGNEAVLFSDVGTYKTLILRRFLRPRIYPEASFALLTVAIIFPLNFYAQSSLIATDAEGLRNPLVIAAAQLLLFAAPVVFLAWYAKLDVRRTFSLRAPSAGHLIGAVLIAFSVAPISSFLQQVQFRIFPPSETALEMMRQQEALLFAGQSFWVMLVVFGLLPAICEELLFRGFLLSGLRRWLSPVMTVAVVGLVFGFFHVDPVKVPIISLLGALLAFVCLRSGTILLPMLIHVANNGLALVSTRSDAIRSFFGLPGSESDLGIVQLDARLAAFLAVFVVGTALVALRRRPDRLAD